MAFPSVDRAEVEGDRVWISLSNGDVAPVTLAEARTMSTDPQAAAAFLRRHVSPKGYR